MITKIKLQKIREYEEVYAHNKWRASFPVREGRYRAYMNGVDRVIETLKLLVDD